MSTEIFRKNLTKIKGSFATLVMRVTKRLERKEIDVKGFRNVHHQPLPPGDIISNASGVADIFEAISRHQLWITLTTLLLRRLVKSLEEMTLS